MLRRRVIVLPVMCGLAAVVGWAAAPVAATPASPGACHMMDANPIGIAGMRGAADQGFENMIDLVLASLQAGCSP